jgi:hypothetical protein
MVTVTGILATAAGTITTAIAAIATVTVAGAEASEASSVQGEVPPGHNPLDMQRDDRQAL